MKVLTIPEDFIKNQYILKPIIGSLMEYLGKPRARVEVCQEPRLGGISAALNWDNIESVIRKYPMVDLFLLLVDRDGIEGRRQSLDQIEVQAKVLIDNDRRRFLAEHAWQELEVWILAGMDDLPGPWQWTEIRSEANPKETYYLTYASHRGLMESPGQGRKTLGTLAGRNYPRIRHLCREDVLAVENRIHDWMEGLNRT